MSAQVFCLLLGALMGAIIMGMIWVIVNDVTRRPERRVGQRTNRPEQWIRTPDGWVYTKEGVSIDALRSGRLQPKINEDLAEAMMKDELEKVLRKLDERRERDGSN